ncbi:uncharacterized protein [Palaemon carinicauda]|uniref:uncharacterized protein n=1 Tax=Palaemon carinicauda TaxID=392227 RepID=UPI0035B5E5B6
MCSRLNITRETDPFVLEPDEEEIPYSISTIVMAVCVILCVVTLVSGMAVVCGVLSGDGGFRRTMFSKFNSARILQCSHVAAGILNIMIFTPTLLSAVIRNYLHQEPVDWLCNLGWLTGTWGWTVQLFGTSLINYERFAAVTSPITGQVSTSTSLILAGISWICGGAVAGMINGVFKESPIILICTCKSDFDYLDSIIYVLLPLGLVTYAITGCFWVVIVVAAKRQGRVTASRDCSLENESSVGSCSRPKCPYHREVELVTIAKSSSPFCPRCATIGWWATSPRPENRTQALLSSVGKWTVPLVLGMNNVNSSIPQGKTNPPSSDHHLSIPYSGEMSTSPCPSPGPFSKGNHEDTFTMGGIYIGSLESHIRTHQAFCSGLNIRSQGCQTGTTEVSPPVIEWRMNTSHSSEKLNRPQMTHVGVQCNPKDFSNESQTEQTVSYMLQLAGEVCVRDARARLAGRTHLEYARTLPVFMLTLCQIILWLPLAVTVLIVKFTCYSVEGWEAIIITVCIGNLSPAFAPLLYFAAARCSSVF